MPRLVLLQPPHRDTFGYSMPPVGLLHAAAGARAAGHEVAFLDLALLTRRGDIPATTPRDADRLACACAERVAALRPDAVGLGAMLSSMPAALELAAELHHAVPHAPLILGGQGPEQVEEAILARHPAVDAVAVGEADETLADWLDAACGSARPDRPRRAPRDVPGLVVRDETTGAPRRTPPRPLLQPLDRVPPPAWDLAEPPAAYARAGGQACATFPIDLGRGCTYACTFCTTPVFWQRTARHLSPARAADELDRLAALGAGAAYVTHDLFTFDRERVLAICAEKRRRGNTLAWECRTRLDLVDEELLAGMAAAGCTRILFGVESDRPDVLRRMNKAGRSEALDVRGALRMVERAGISAILGTMAGVPGETAEDVESNLRLMARAATGRGVSLSLHWFNVTPGNGRAAEAGGAGEAAAGGPAAGPAAASRDTCTPSGEQMVCIRHGAAEDTPATAPDLDPAAADRRGSPLRLVPGLFADLVRGHDLPAGHVPEAQRRMIAADPQVFAGFRTFAPPHATPRELFLLTRHAHVMLEALPRTLRALAAETGRTLASLVLESVRDGLAAARDEDREEPLVLGRVVAVRAAGRLARRLGSPAVATLARYEETLHGTLEPRLDRFAHDPRPLVAAADEEAWPPAAAACPVDTLSVRRGDAVRTFVVGSFVADVAAGLEGPALAARWPALDAAGLAAQRTAARAALERLTGGERATDCRAAAG